MKRFNYLEIVVGHYIRVEGTEWDELFALLIMEHRGRDVHFQYYLN